MTEADLAELGRDDLVALILGQAATIREQAALLEKQAAAIEALGARVEELTRSGKRQAAPFSKATRVEGPGRPGRKPGQGVFKRREAPDPESPTEPPVDVPVAQPACTRCGGDLAFERVEE